jgi:peptidylprolyl isomerase
MKKMILSGIFLAASAMAAQAAGMKVETSIGCSFTIEFREDIAPKHVAQVTKIAKSGQYDNVVFHRVMAGFMAQTGDVQYGKVGGDTSVAGIGGSQEPDLPAEFSKEPFVRGMVGMARSQDPNSANSQFFVVLVDSMFLNEQYTAFGKVPEEGMACVDKIKKGEDQNNGAVVQPDHMTKVTVQ